ncbi:MAG TPA: ATP/GTP-binding protein [Gallionellaceae bacterium]
MENKIVFAGPVGAGKTTAINSVSDIPVVGTEAKASDEVALLKSNTTVAMDYGILNLEGGRKVHLYGTPGQDRFDFMWDILSKGAMGFVILVDSTRADPISDLQTYLKAFGKSIYESGDAVVIGITRTEFRPQTELIDRINEFLGSLKLNIPVFEVDGRKRDDVKQMLLALLTMLDPAILRARSA